MNIGRKTLLVLITPLFPLLLFATALDMGIVRVAGQPDPVKKILSDSGIYQNVIPNLLSQAKNISSNGATIPLTDPSVQSAAQAVFSPQFIQQSTNNAIDGIYHWLDGKTPAPDFKIDLSSQKTALAQAIGKIAEQRAASLSICTSAASISAASQNYLGATCIPPGVAPSIVASQVEFSVVGGQGFLDNLTITPNDIKSSNSNQSVFADQLKSVPKQYQRAKATPLIFAVLAIAAGAAIVFLSSTRRKGLRHIGITLVIVGVVMLAFSWGLNYAVNQKLLPKLDFNNPALQSDIKAVAMDLVQTIDKNYWLFGGVYTALGATAVAYTMFVGRGLQTAPNDTPENNESAGEPKIPKPSGAKPKKIQ